MHVNTSIGVVVVVDVVIVPVLTLAERFLEISVGDVFDVFGNEVGRRKLSLVSMSHIRTVKSPRSTSIFVLDSWLRNLITKKIIKQSGRTIYYSHRISSP